MSRTAVIAACAAVFVAAGCSGKRAGGPARVPVTVAHAEQRALPLEILATGSVEPLQTVSIQSQVTGVLLRAAFREGDEVTAGQLLFQVDPRPFQSALEQDRKSTRLNSSHMSISYAVFCLKKKKKTKNLRR